MDITFLIGNGFDIGLGLKTRYGDFYSEYSVPSETDSPCVKAFKQELRQKQNGNQDKTKNIINWSDFEKAFGEYSVHFTKDTKEEYKECFRHFNRRFNEYLEQENKKANFTNAGKIGEVMKNAVETFYHLQIREQRDVASIINNSSGAIAYNFVSFNYTDCLMKCVDILKKQIAADEKHKVGRAFHIHGTIAEGMIMGVNDEKQILNKELASDSEIVDEIVKPKINSMMGTDCDQTLKNIICNSTIICVYGMSIGDTDKTWWVQIAKWLAGDKPRRLIILAHESDYSPKFPFSRRDIITKYKNKFLSAAEVKDAGTINSQIIVGINHDIFENNVCIDVPIVPIQNMNESHGVPAASIGQQISG